MITLQHYFSFLLTLAATALVGIYSFRLIKSPSDFNVGGRKLTTRLVSGSLIGAFVGGTSTVGTAQVAFQCGLSGIWFTLGAGIGCLLMGLFLVKPLRQAEVDTIPQYLGKYYGTRVVTWASVYTTLGMFIQIIAQILAAIPLLMVILPVTSGEAALLATALMVLYIFFGGFWGTSLVGLFKTVLIYASLGVAGIFSLKMAGGITGLQNHLSDFPYFTFFPGGLSKELAAVFSVVVGFISTQTYMQVVFAAKDVRSARNGVLLSGLLIPLIGAASVFIGMYMRAYYPEINAAMALPMFIINHLPPLFGGVVLAALLISLVMTGASLTLGVCTTLCQDIYQKLFRQQAGDSELLKVARLLVLLVGSSALTVVLSHYNSLILQWAFLSMALRGVTVFFPLMAAVFYQGKVPPRAALVAITISPAVAAIWPFWQPVRIEPLYLGLAISLISLYLGSLGNSKELINKKM
ncbi:sodium:solute symporter family protein [Desulforamulus hydrothermalis]|uniref:Na+/solute symporter n=1 Tax=Desulforamulus hydrothermalis Lam5 = DSM 18033 TaxID=1121428 RepID=K8DXW9_9FIRM|nr:sodium:solute symporter family protein [Desulforamulus hydrothermalis]CCO07460.1 Na+/solute symporter [Desulforamulus hydrothermalis Lam5 = DSM 18033]SHH18010.1 solute:Na+ symporter, SSS family [Desulforamulus hydrothermalis Lam5 = DSM 18033]